MSAAAAMAVLLAGLCAGLLGYAAAPAVLARLHPECRRARRSGQVAGRPGSCGGPAFLRGLLARTGARCRLAGIRATAAPLLLLLAFLFLPLLLAALLLSRGYGPTASLFCGLAGAAFLESRIRMRIHKRQEAFSLGAYRMYRFLDAQLSAGVRITDAIRGLHEVVRTGPVREALLEFVATYELTLDLETALDRIRGGFDGFDRDMFCATLRQCVETGGAGDLLVRMEEIQFGHYMNLLQRETEAFRTRLLVHAMGAMVPCLLLILLPILNEAFQALQGLMT